MKVDILAIGVHPDDVELSCSGTLLRHIDLGYKVGLLDLTQGEMGTRGSVEDRMREAENSRKIMGAEWRINLQMEDAFFEYSRENILKITEVIRRAQPKIVLGNAIQDRHPDHGRASKLIEDACFYSGLAKVEQDFEGKSLDPWRPDAVYHYIQDRNLKADFVVDISNYMEKKIECILAFESQFYKEGMEGPKTPISGKDFLDFVKSKNRTYARDIKVDFAEAFTIKRDIGVTNLFNLI